jgi:hypothetical protein
MALTDKSTYDFINWLDNKYDIHYYNQECALNVCLNALIIEWFDSVNIYINIKSKFGQIKQCERFSFIVKTYNSGFIFNSRNEAIEEAIKKANFFYNK